MAALSNKAYDTKADVFGLQNDVSALKAADENLSAEVKAALDSVDSVANQRSREENQQTLFCPEFKLGISLVFP